MAGNAYSVISSVERFEDVRKIFIGYSHAVVDNPYFVIINKDIDWFATGILASIVNKVAEGNDEQVFFCHNCEVVCYVNGDSVVGKLLKEVPDMNFV